MGIVSGIKEFFLSRGLIRRGEAISDAQSLLESGVIDSFAIMELVAHIEDVYGISVDVEDLVPENFDSLSAIKTYIEKRQAGAENLKRSGMGE